MKQSIKNAASRAASGIKTAWGKVPQFAQMILISAAMKAVGVPPEACQAASQIWDAMSPPAQVQGG